MLTKLTLKVIMVLMDREVRTMILNLKDISVKEGSSLPFEYALDLSDIAVFGEKPFINPFEIRGKVYNRAGVLELSAVASSEASFKCARCAKVFSKEVEVPIFHILTNSSENQSDDNDYLEIKDFSLDLDSVVFDEVVLASDMVHLCKEDCKGLCSKCGKDLNEGSCDCSHKEIDPRLAPLQKLLDNKNYQ